MFSKLISDVVVQCKNVPGVHFTDFLFVMKAIADAAVWAVGVMRYPLPYPVDAYISWFVPLLDARRFAVLPVCQTMSFNSGNGECEKADAGCRWRLSHWSGWRAADSHMHAGFMGMPFLRSVMKEGYATKLSALIGRVVRRDLVQQSR